MKTASKLEKVLEEFSAKSAQSNIEEILKDSKNIKGCEVVIAEIKNADMALLRKSADAVKSRLKKAVFVFVSEKDKKLAMVVGAQPQLDAVKILNDIGAGFGIKGGGRPDFAQAGSRAGVDIRKILKKAEQVISSFVIRDL